MKKLLACLLALTALFALVSCNADVREAKEKTFSSNGLELTLTEAFKETTAEGYTVCYDSSKVAVFALKEKKSDFVSLGDVDLPAYANLIKEANKSKSPSDIQSKDGLTYMTYQFTNSDSNKEYSYLTVMYEADDAFWMVQFATLTEDYAEYESFLFDCAKSVKV